MVVIFSKLSLLMSLFWARNNLWSRSTLHERLCSYRSWKQAIFIIYFHSAIWYHLSRGKWAFSFLTGIFPPNTHIVVHKGQWLRSLALFYFSGSGAPVWKTAETLEIGTDYGHWLHSPTTSLSLLWNFHCLRIYICKMEIMCSCIRAAFSNTESTRYFKQDEL